MIELSFKCDENVTFWRFRYSSRRMKQNDSFYLVAIVVDAQFAVPGGNEILTQLICPAHFGVDEWARRSSAKEIAGLAVKDRYPESSGDIGYISASRFCDDLPTANLAPDFRAPCGCLAWYWRGDSEEQRRAASS
jgi:hypothetical protein